MALLAAQQAQQGGAQRPGMPASLPYAQMLAAQEQSQHVLPIVGPPVGYSHLMGGISVGGPQGQAEASQQFVPVPTTGGSAYTGALPFPTAPAAARPAAAAGSEPAPAAADSEATEGLPPLGEQQQMVVEQLQQELEQELEQAQELEEAAASPVAVQPPAAGAAEAAQHEVQQEGGGFASAAAAPAAASQQAAPGEPPAEAPPVADLGPGTAPHAAAAPAAEPEG